MNFLRSLIVLLAITVVFESCEPEGDPVAPKATHLYFSDYSGKKLGVVDLANLNNFTTIADESDGLDTLTGIAVDFEGGKIYAAEELNNRVVRFNLDGTGTLDVLYEMVGTDSIVYEPTAVAIDPEEGYLYWANSGTGQLRRGSLDGSASAYVMYDSAEILTYCYGLVMNKKINRIMFSDFGEFAGVYAASLLEDDINDSLSFPVRVFFPGYALRNPSQIFVDEPSQRLYWADETQNTLVSGLITSGAFSVAYDDEDNISHPAGVAVDFGSGKIYWSEPGNKVIKRANLDGTGEPEVVLTNVESYSIVLRYENQK